MKTISTKSLESISRHKNKVLRLASYLLESESPYIIQKMAEVSPDSNVSDVVAAINKDLASTAKFVNALAKVIQTVDEHGFSTELDNGQTNFNELFPNHYEHGQLNVFGVRLSRVNGTGMYKPEEIKACIFNNAFASHSFEDFKGLVKLVNKVASQGEVTFDMPFETRLARVSQLHALKSYSPFVADALASAKLNFEVRMKMTDNEKMLVDQQIMGGRAMIDGVTLASTHISKSDGIVKVASAHKKQHKLLNEIKEMVSDLPYLKAVEIDPDTDLQKFHDMVKSISHMRFSNSEPFELKSRKLGNYGASGLNVVTSDGEDRIEAEYGYASNLLRIVAVDVRAPTSLAHEIAHYSDTELNASSMLRSKMVRHFADKMDNATLMDMYGDKTVGYLNNDREVVARLGEIGFALHQIGFEEGDTTEVVLKKSKAWEASLKEGDATYHVAIVKDMEAYMAAGEHSGDVYKKESYFNMAEWTPEELGMVKDYTQSFYFDMQPEVQAALVKRLESHGAKLSTYTKMQAKRERTRRARPLSEQEIRLKVWGVLKQEKDILGNLMEIGQKERLFDQGEFSYYATLDLSTVFAGSRKRNSLSPVLISLQYENYENLVEKANELEATAELAVLQYGAGKMAEAFNEKSEPEGFDVLSHSSRFLISRMANSEELAGVPIQDFMSLRVSNWTTLNSDSVTSNKWREKIKNSYSKATEGLEGLIQEASFDSIHPVAQHAFTAAYLLNKADNLPAIDERLERQLHDDAFNMRLDHFTDEDRGLGALMSLSESQPHQNLVDTSQLMFALGDTGLELELVDGMVNDGLLEKLDITPEYMESLFNTEQFKELGLEKVKPGECVMDYFGRLQSKAFPQESGNYHDKYLVPSEEVTSTNRTYLKATPYEREPLRTSSLHALAYLAQAKGDEASIKQFMVSLSSAMENSTKFKEVLDAKAVSNVAEYNFFKMNATAAINFRGAGVRIHTPESLLVEKALLAKEKSPTNSKIVNSIPTEMLKDAMKSKVMGDVLIASNPKKPEPMSVKAVKLSGSVRSAVGQNVRILPVGKTASQHLAESTHSALVIVQSVLSSVSNKVNTPEYKDDVLLKRSEGRDAAIEYGDVLINLENSLGTKAYEVLRFSQNTDLTQIPRMHGQEKLERLWSSSSNYLIQYHQDVYEPVEAIVGERNDALSLERSAEIMRERIANLDINKQKNPEMEESALKVDAAPESVEKPAPQEEPPIPPVRPSYGQQRKMF